MFGEEVEVDAVVGAGQGDGPDEQDDEDQVGEGGRHIHHLSARFDTLDKKYILGTKTL